MTGRGALRLRSGARRRLVIVLELGAAATICFLGYRLGARWLQEHEARWVVDGLRLAGLDSVSGALPGHILIFGSAGSVLNAEVTASCSSLLSILGLTALTTAVFRQRRQHALGGLLVAIGALLVLNWARLTVSTLAGIWWGRPAMILFHDWVGSLWNLAATFLGFLVLVALTLPASERAEQDANGRHTAGRPSSWARPGLGYQMSASEPDVKRGGRGVTGFFYRYILPRRFSAQLGRRREAGRIDYRIGHLRPEDRAARVRELAADGLGAHAASLLAVATYDRDLDVLDTLAREVAAQQWEPVTNARMTSLRLWARGWMMSRGAPTALIRPDATRPIAEVGVVTLQATSPRRPESPPPASAGLPARPRPRSFAAAPGGRHRATHTLDELVVALPRSEPGGTSRPRAVLPMTSLPPSETPSPTPPARPARPRSFAANPPAHHDAVEEPR